MEYKGKYPLDGIKYFRPEGIEFEIKCPKCGNVISMNAGDDFIEYPKETQRIDWIECEKCEEEIQIDVDIKLECTVIIEPVTVRIRHGKTD